MKIKTIIFNFITFSLLLIPIIHAASDAADLQSLLEAVGDGDLEKVQKLIEGGIDPNTANDKGDTALILATDKDHFEIVKYLLEREDVDPDLQNNEGDSALIWASYQEFENIVKLLLEHDAKPDLQDNEGVTALIQASIKANKNIVELLLKHNAKPDLQDDDGDTALKIVSYQEFENMVKLLLEHNAKPDLPNNEGITALIQASKDGNEDIVKLLLEHNANTDLQNNQGDTALIWTSIKGNENIVELLLEHKANVNLQDKYGWTALMFASNSGYPGIVKLLLENDADITKKSKKGETALEIAEQKGNTKIVEIMMPFFIEKKMAITEEQRQKLAREQDGIDLISLDDITKEPLDKLMILEKHLFLRKTIMDHMISKVGSKEGILDPFTRQPISAEIQLALLGYFSLPINLLKSGGPIYKDAADLQKRENWIVMTGEPETEKGKKELKKLEDEAAELKKRIRDTLARYNYSYAE